MNPLPGPVSNYKPLITAAAFSALLGPGMGQFYNREWKKAMLFIFLLLALGSLFIAFFVIAAKAHLEWIAQNQPEMLMAQGDEIQLARDLVSKHSGALSVFKWSLIILWCWSIVDAYVGGKKRVER